MCGLVPGVRNPPPPPPPPLVQVQTATKDLVGKAVAYCKRHPYHVAGAFGTLLLADFLNLALLVDKLDPVVNIIKLVSKPFALLWRVIARRRAESLVAAAAGGAKRSAGAVLRGLVVR